MIINKIKLKSQRKFVKYLYIYTWSILVDFRVDTPAFKVWLHNYICVLRIVISIISANKKTRMIQLMGAVATLALLGIPWLFSAFGAIDAVKNDNLAMMEGVFQVTIIYIDCIACIVIIVHG